MMKFAATIANVVAETKTRPRRGMPAIKISSSRMISGPTCSCTHTAKPIRTDPNSNFQVASRAVRISDTPLKTRKGANGYCVTFDGQATASRE